MTTIEWYKAAWNSQEREIKQLKDELRSIDRALNDNRLNLTHTATEIILELKKENKK